jgi:hypothetical protein
MIFIFLPQIVVFLILKQHVDMNIFLKIILTPIIYILFNIYLYRVNKFNEFHKALEYITPFYMIETKISQTLQFIKKVLLSVDRINKLYVKCKVKIVLFTMQFMTRFIPGKQISALEEELQNEYAKLHGDYVHILQRNRYRRASKPLI